jgi:hypothetical protein
MLCLFGIENNEFRKSPFYYAFIKVTGGESIKNRVLKCFENELKWSASYLYLLKFNQFSFPFTIYTTYNTIHQDTYNAKN